MAKVIPWWIKPETAKRLNELGSYKDTQDSIICKLLDGYAAYATNATKVKELPSSPSGVPLSKAGPDARVAAGVVGKWIPDADAPGYEVLITEGGYKGTRRPERPAAEK